MIFKIWSNLFLMVCAWIDFKTKKVYPGICIVNYILAIGIKILGHGFNLKTAMLGIGLCGGLFVVSLLTKQALGQGDVFILLTLTGILEAESVLGILVIGLFICSVFSFIMLLIKKKKGKDVIPFVPFLMAGQWLWFMLGG